MDGRTRDPFEQMAAYARGLDRRGQFLLPNWVFLLLQLGH
jgi:hypothetical protein